MMLCGITVSLRRRGYHGNGGWWRALGFLLALTGVAAAQTPYKQFVEPGQFIEGGGTAYLNGKNVLLRPRATGNHLLYELPTVAPAGDYRLAVKCYNTQPGKYAAAATLTFTLNGSSTTREWPDQSRRTARKYTYLEFPPFTTTQAGRELRLEWRFDGKDAEKLKSVNLVAIYLTTDPQDKFTGGTTLKIAGSDDDDSTKGNTPVNYLENGSFEAGFEQGWRFWSGNSNHLLKEREWLAGDAFHGQHYLRCNDRLQSDFFSVAADGDFVLKGVARVAEETRLSVSLVDRFDSKKPLHSATIQLKAAPGWQTFRQKWQIPAGDYLVRLQGSRECDLDALGLYAVANEPERFAPYRPLEAGFVLPELDTSLTNRWQTRQYIGAVYQQGEPVGVDLRVSIDDARQQQPLTIEVRDFNERVVERRDCLVRTLAGGAGRTSLVFTNFSRSGNFRLAASLPNGGATLAETVFSVMPRSEPGLAKRPPALGVYASLSPHNVPMMKRAGLDYLVSFSCAPDIGDWARQEPKRGQYVFHDKEVDLAVSNGVTLCALLDYRDGGPSWLPKRAGSRWMFADDRDWRNFVAAMVSHYRGRISDYMVMDDLSKWFNAADYLECLKAASEAIRQADPAARVIGWNYLYWSGLDEAQKGEFSRKFEGLSDIMFMGFRKEVERYGRRKPMWRYFAGGAGDTFFRTRTSTRELGGIVEERDEYGPGTVNMLRRMLAAFEEGGVERFLYYEGRVPASPKSLYEWNGAFTPAGAALAVFNALFRGFRCDGSFDLGGLEVKIMRDGGGELPERFALWPKAGIPRRLAVREPLPLHDLMGNAIAASRSGDEYCYDIDDAVYYLLPGAPGTGERLRQARVESRERLRTYLRRAAQGFEYVAELPGAEGKDAGGWACAKAPGDPFASVETLLSGVAWKYPLSPAADGALQAVVPLNVAPEAQLKSRPIELELRSGSQREVIRERLFLIRAPRAKPRRGGVMINGNADDLYCLTRQNVNPEVGLAEQTIGASTLGYRLLFRHDDANLYVHVAISGSGYALQRNSNVFKLYLAPDARYRERGHLVEIDLEQKAATLDGTAMAAGDCAVVRESDNSVACELRLPFAQLGLGAAGAATPLLGFNSMLVTTSGAEEFFLPLLAWGYVRSAVPERVGYLDILP